MENINLIEIIDRVKNNEYITDIAEELDTNTHVILRIMEKHKNIYTQLLDYIKEDSKNRKEKSIKNEVKKEIEKTLLINRINCRARLCIYLYIFETFKTCRI